MRLKPDIRLLLKGSIPRIQRFNSLLFADLEEGVEHASVAHLCVLGLTLDLQPGLSQVDGKCP